MDVDMSLEQIIKKNKMRGGKPIRGKRGEGKGNGAPPTTITITNNKPQPKRSSLPIKRRRPSSIKSTTITTSTSNANNTASPPIPALKITIQNTPSSSSSSLSTSGIKKTITGGKPGKLGGGSIGGSPSLKPKIRKSLSSDSPLKKRLDTRNNNIVVRSKNTPTRGGGSHSGGHIHNNNNHHHHNQPQQSQYEDNEDFGSGSSLFERRSGYSPSSPSNSSYSPSTSRKPIQLYTGSRLNISNLHYGITESDLSVLFKKFGDVKNIRINYDSAGRSNGTGYCIFSRHADALQAMEMYNKIALDGKLLHITLGSSFQEDVRNL